MTASGILKSGKGRLALGVAVFSALAVAPTHAADGLGKAPEGQKPTVVLVHGAFADGSSWNAVVQRLQRDGYHVMAPPNTLRGIPQDSTYLNSLLKTIKGPIVLVGHSYGGEVISQAAAGVDNVKALVFIDAIMPDKGESFASLSAKFPTAPLAKAFMEVPFRNGDGTTGTDVYIRPEKLHETFAQDLSQQQASIMAATQRPIAQSAFTAKLTEAAWRDKPVYVLVGKQDRGIDPSLERYEAKRAHARKTVEINSSHVSLVSHPQAVTDLIVTAAHDSGQQ
ncbi:alpha/beta hydrolase [Streptomyces sp. CB02959]|uniref:alpha/beta fold hydrolase n=1 Tax=Streptomyces sp. CB02959 TaxID=2020330 RepID=UPI000C2777B1|nr:alpha/beta fold hydrolase [Streptomyces sp. CB02959]PJN35800.1 alpha/beta hydrolase [Streptomyces sp. CB02959]